MVVKKKLGIRIDIGITIFSKHCHASYYGHAIKNI